MTPQDMENLVRELQGQVASLHAQVAALQDPRGRIFLADVSNSGSTNRAMEEMVPTAAGTALQHLVDGRSVSGLTDPGVFLAIDALGSGQRAFLGFQNGTNSVYVPISEQVRFGVVQAVADCNAYCTVKESDSDGIILSDVIVTVSPAPGCDTASGFCYTVGGVIAYMADPKDTTFGVQVGAYKSISVRYTCTTTNSANVPDLSELALYPGDFTIDPHSTCGGADDNEADVYWNGNFVRQYSGIGSNFDHVKVWDFDNVSHANAGGTINVDYSELAVHITSGTTSANVPTIGGSPCADQSFPNYVKFSIRAKIGTAVASVNNPVCNEDGTISITYATMRVLVPLI